MPKLHDIFPSASQCKPSKVNWDAGFSWTASNSINLAQSLRADFYNSTKLHMSEFKLRCKLLHDDLTEQLSTCQDERKKALIDVLKFSVGQIPTSWFTSTGNFPDAYDWALWSISRNYEIGKRMNETEYCLPPFDGADDLANRYCIQFMVDWVESAYYLAVRFGGLDELARRNFQYCYTSTLKTINDSSGSVGIRALTILTSWAAYSKHKQLSNMVGMIESLVEDPKLSAQDQILLGVSLIGDASFLRQQSAAEFATGMLSKHAGQFQNQDHLQYLVAATDTYEAWLCRKDEILSKIAAVRSDVEEISNSKIDINISMEGRIRIIYSLIFLLSNVPDIVSALSIIARWYGTELATEKVDKHLLVLPNDFRGTTWVWSTGNWTPINRDGKKSLEELMASISNAFTDYFRGPEGDRVPVVDERLSGTPSVGRASDLRHCTLEHYAIPGAVRTGIFGVGIKSIVFFPNHQVPAFAMVNEVSPSGLLQVISLNEPPNEPEIANVLIWPGHTLLTDAEVEFLLAVGETCGWEVRVYGNARDNSSFSEFFSDSDADLLWIIGHGNYDHHNVDGCGLVLNDGELFSLRDFSTLPTPNKTRGIVANICSGGTARVIGGLGTNGIAGALCNGNQFVVSHGWPVDMYAALAFGGVYFSNLPEFGMREGLRKAQVMLRDQDHILSQIGKTSHNLSISERLRCKGMKPRLENVLSWGSTAIYI